MPKLSCPNCGMQQDKSWEDGGKGYMDDGDNYCCRGCAEDTGCTCAHHKGPVLNAD